MIILAFYLSCSHDRIFDYFPEINNRPQCEKNYLWGFANNKGADQPANLCCLISAFVNRQLKMMIGSSLAICRISNYELVHLAQQVGLNITLSQNPKKDFLLSRPNYYLIITYRLL